MEASTAPDPVPPCADGTFRVVELNLTTPTWPAALARAAADGLPLDVRLVTDGSSSPLAAVAAALAPHDVRRVMPFDAMLHVSDATTVTATRDALTRTGIAASVIGGVRSHFTELNRESHRLPADLDGIAFSTTPLFHTFDTEQLVEALSMQRIVALQAVEMSAGRPVHIGPVSSGSTTPSSPPQRPCRSPPSVSPAG
ncbi:hypothetical protein [Microbacterium sp.]|uniref:hypothetical protein n=1 Tax=Microbacterium sp. TaxID=51671 RepID=UPI003F9D7660